MRNICRSAIVVVMISLFSLVAYSQFAEAVSIRMSELDTDGVGVDTAVSFEILDNIGGDLDGDLGSIKWFGAVDDFNVAFSMGLTKPVSGTAGNPVMDFDVTSVSGGYGNVLTFEFTEVGYGPLDPGLLGFISAFSATTNGTVTIEAFYDVSNDAYGQGQSIGLLSPGTGAGISDNDVFLGIPAANPFSITIVATIDHSAISSGNSTLGVDITTAVPEPGTVALLGIGLAGLVGVSARRRVKKKAA